MENKNESIMDVVETTKIDSPQFAENVVVPNQQNLQQFSIPRRTRTIIREFDKIGRNDPCPCGSDKKYKNCCLKTGEYENHIELNKDQAYKVADHQAQILSFRNSL